MSIIATNNTLNIVINCDLIINNQRDYLDATRDGDAVTQMKNTICAQHNIEKGRLTHRIIDGTQDTHNVGRALVSAKVAGHTMFFVLSYDASDSLEYRAGYVESTHTTLEDARLAFGETKTETETAVLANYPLQVTADLILEDHDDFIDQLSEGDYEHEILGTVHAHPEWDGEEGDLVLEIIEALDGESREVGRLLVKATLTEFNHPSYCILEFTEDDPHGIEVASFYDLASALNAFNASATRCYYLGH